MHDTTHDFMHGEMHTVVHQARRSAQLNTMQRRRDATRDMGVELRHPFFTKKAGLMQCSVLYTIKCRGAVHTKMDLQSVSSSPPDPDPSPDGAPHPDRAAQAEMTRRGQQRQDEWEAVRRHDIYFVPPKFAATMPHLVKGRRSVDQRDSVKQARNLAHGAAHCTVYTALRTAHCTASYIALCTVPCIAPTCQIER